MVEDIIVPGHMTKMGTASKPADRKRFEVALDDVLVSLSREFNLPFTHSQAGAELRAGTYVVRREPSRLSYEDKIATVHFNQSKPPTLDYHVSASYLEGQLKLLRSTGTRVGEQLALQLAALDLSPEVDAETSRRLAHAGYDPRKHSLHVVSLVQKLEIPDYQEAYEFIRGHILFH